MILWFIAAIVILLTVSVLAFVLPNLGLKQIENSEVFILEDDKVNTIPNEFVRQFTGSQKSSFRIFYFVNSLPRTGVSVDDVTLGASNFNSTTNTFEICPLNQTSDCKHPGFVSLLQFGNAITLELLQVPDASRPGLPKAQLVIKTIRNTNATTNTEYLETFPLPAFPLQKWVMVTLTRQGSLFTVYYNDRLVGSFQTNYAPSISASTGFFGDAQIRGLAKYLKATNFVSSAADVRKDHQSMTDTRGLPIESLFGQMKISLCPSGDCFRGPDVRPANPHLSWETEYM